MKTAFEVAARQMGTNPDGQSRIKPPRQHGDQSKPANAPYYPVDRRQQGHDFGQPSKQMQ